MDEKMKQSKLDLQQERWFSQDMLDLLSNFAVTRVYWAKEIIYHQEESAGWCYYLKKGRVRVFIASEDGVEKTLAIYKEQGLFGEAAFFEGHLRTTTAVAMEESEVLVISKENMLECFREEPLLAWSVMGYLSQTIRLLSTQINEMTFLSARKRLIQFLIGEWNKKNSTLSYTQEEIGALIGASRVTVSREINYLKRCKVIKVQYGRVTIQDVERLKEMLSL